MGGIVRTDYDADLRGPILSRFSADDASVRLLALPVLLAVLSSPALGQDGPHVLPDLPGWQIEMSAGVHPEPLWAGLGLHLSAGERYVVRVGYDGATEFTLGGTPTTMNAVSVAGGARAYPGGPFRLAAHAGPAVVWGHDRFDRERAGPNRQPYVTAGLVANASAVVEVDRLGLGFDVSATVSPVLSTVGARVAFHFRLDREP